MDRIIADDSVNHAGMAVPPATGTPQYAGDGPPGTVFPAYQYNAIQEELLAVIDDADIAFDRFTLTQLRDALRILKGSRVTKTLNLADLPYTLQRSDIGTIVRADPEDGSACQINIPSGVFESGDEIIIYAYESANVTIHREAGVTLQLTTGIPSDDYDISILKGGRGLLWKSEGGAESFTMVDQGQCSEI